MTASREQLLPLTAAVLVGAGGRGGRVDGALLDSAARAHLAAVVDAVGDVCAETLVVTPRPEVLGEVGFSASVGVVVSESPDSEALGELASAMSAARHEWVLAVSAQRPIPEPSVIDALWAARDSAEVVAYVGEEGLHTMPALYKVEPCLPAALNALATGRRRLIAMFAALRVVAVPTDEHREAAPAPLPLGSHDSEAGVAAEGRVARGDSSAAPLSETADATQGVSGPASRSVQVTTGRPNAMPSERPITIYLNDIEVATTQATPRDLEELGVGFLVSEGLLVDRTALVSLDADSARGLVYVTSTEVPPKDLAGRARYLTSGCGGGVTFASAGHARGIKPVTSELTVDPAELYSLVGKMAHAAVMYRETGGVHACGLARTGRLEFVREDVGRHNALDKLLGRAWLDGIPTSDAVLISTGRISYEMAVKAAKAAVPIVATRSAVTDLAADIGDELGITLVGYVRAGKLTVYTHPQRVLAPEGD